ncbi:MAG: flavodoxin [Firmicutes bacterium]|nr:flavodoxin [Bacillota bacterium]
MDFSEKKALVAYFSTKGVTKEAAEKVAAATDGKLFEIQAKEPYTDADLDWRVPDSRCNREFKDPTIRPELLKKAHCPGKYDVYFVGFPIWYGVYPAIVQSFLDSLKLAGKTVVFFCTSGGSNSGKSIAFAKEHTKDADKVTWLDDKLLTNASPEDVKAWVDAL